MNHWIRKLAFTAFLFLGPALAFANGININTADADTLATELKGIGASKAAAIVSYREQYGPFQSTGDLTNVPGIGEKTIDRLGASITVGN